MHVIYITGLGDQKAVWQRRAVAAWRIHGVMPHFFQVRWADDEAFGPKLEKLLKLVDELYEKDSREVGIVAASAGVSMALHALVARNERIKGVVSICGKIQHPEGVHDSYKHENPAFSKSMDLLPSTLRSLSGEMKQKITCLYPYADHVVPLQDQRIPGAKNKRVVSFGHVATITLQITLASFFMLRNLKKTRV